MDKFLNYLHLATTALTQRTYYKAIDALALAYTSENLWDAEGNFRVSTEGLRDSMEVITQLSRLPEIDAQDLVNAIMQQMHTVLENTEQNDEEEFKKVIQNFKYLIEAFRQGIGMLDGQDLPIGSREDPTIRLGFFLEKDKINAHLYGKISSNPTGLNSEDALALQEVFLETMEGNSNYQQMINLASRLSNQGEYQNSNDLLEKIIGQYPNEKASSLNLIGANWFFLANYEKAIEYYVQALEAGENEEMIDFNVWEACRELHKGADTAEEALQWENYYKRLFPQGKNRF